MKKIIPNKNVLTVLYMCMFNDEILQINELIQKAQRGDQHAFNGLVAFYGKPVFSFILNMAKNLQLAEDIYQETWLKVFHHLPQYKETGNFRSWVFKIANRLCQNQFRSARNIFLSIPDFFENQNGEYLTGKIPDNLSLPDVELEQKEAIGFVERALQSMPFKQKQVFLLRVEGELRFKEIASILNRPLNTVLTQMQAGLIHIRKILSELYDEMPGGKK